MASPDDERSDLMDTRPTRRRLLACAVVSALLSGLIAPQVALGATDLQTVIGNLVLWLSGLLASIATVFLIVGGVRYAMAGGDPVRHERAKSAISSAVLGYAFALLAPVAVTIIQQIVGG
jgi:hypothetical protein